MTGKWKERTPVNKNSKRPSKSVQVDNDSDDSKSDTSGASNKTTVGGDLKSGANATKLDDVAKQLLNLKITRTPAPDHNFDGKRTGKMRNLIEIDILLIDNKDYKGSVLEMEVHQLICRKTLKIKRKEIKAIGMSWVGHPLATIRLENEVDIDSFPKHFCYFKPGRDTNGKEIQHKVVCGIRGVRDGTEEKPRREEESPNGPWTRWVKVEGNSLDLSRTQIKDWLQEFGGLESDLEAVKMVFNDQYESSEDEESDTEPKIADFTTPDLSVKMTITKKIPQFIPAYGKRFKVYYRGIAKQCSRCFETTHRKAECQNELVPWIAYVSDFMLRHDWIPKKLYGRWTFLVDAYRATINITATATEKENELNRQRTTKRN